MQHEYANCPFCGSNNIGPSYWEFVDKGKKYECTAISCMDCAAHGPVRNDYPLDVDTTANQKKADEAEEWTRNAWNRLPAIDAEMAAKMDSRY